MNSTLRTFTVLSIGLLLGVSLAIGHGVWAEKEESTYTPIPLNELRSLTEVFGRIKQDFVEPVTISRKYLDQLESCCNQLLSN